MKSTLCYLVSARFLLPQAGLWLPQTDPHSHVVVPCFFDWCPPLRRLTVAGCRDPINRRSTRQPTSRTELPSLALSAGCVPSAGPHSIPFFASILVALMSPVLAHPATPKPQNVCAPPSCCSTSKPHRRRASERWQFQFLPFSMNNTARHGRRRFVAVGENLAHSLLPWGAREACATPWLILLVTRWLVAVRSVSPSAMAATPWSTARLKLHALPLLWRRTVVRSRGARARPRSAPSRLPRRIPPWTPPPPVSSYHFSLTSLPRVPLFLWLCPTGRPPFDDAQGAQHTTRGPLVSRRWVRCLAHCGHGDRATPHRLAWAGPAEFTTGPGTVHPFPVFHFLLQIQKFV
jgi:hypothetical protein